MQRNILVCADCFRKLMNDQSYQVEELKNDYGCDCTEIEFDFYDPTSCDHCHDPEKATCPMHLYYLKISAITVRTILKDKIIIINKPRF